MPARKHRDKQLLDDGYLPDDNLANLLVDRIEACFQRLGGFNIIHRLYIEGFVHAQPFFIVVFPNKFRCVVV